MFAILKCPGGGRPGVCWWRSCARIVSCGARFAHFSCATFEGDTANGNGPEVAGSRRQDIHGLRTGSRSQAFCFLCRCRVRRDGMRENEEDTRGSLSRSDLHAQLLSLP